MVRVELVLPVEDVGCVDRLIGWIDRCGAEDVRTVAHKLLPVC